MHKIVFVTFCGIDFVAEVTTYLEDGERHTEIDDIRVATAGVEQDLLDALNGDALRTLEDMILYAAVRE